LDNSGPFWNASYFVRTEAVKTILVDHGMSASQREKPRIAGFTPRLFADVAKQHLPFGQSGHVSGNKKQLQTLLRHVIAAAKRMS
jgi:hypothetical protein